MNTVKRGVSLLAVVTLLALVSGTGGALAQSGGSVSGQAALGTAFTYQGLLKDTSGNPVTATCGFQFGSGMQ